MANTSAAQIRATRANLIPFDANCLLIPTRSGRLKDEMGLQAGLFCAPHHRPQKDGFELTAVIGEVTMWLTEDRNNLRHLKTERPVLVGERGSVTLRLVLLPFDRVRPDLDALSGERSPVACAAHGSRHPEAALADTLHEDRKSTRLNSSHPSISYAVFCLKKKKHHDTRERAHDRHHP